MSDQQRGGNVIDNGRIGRTGARIGRIGFGCPSIGTLCRATPKAKAQAVPQTARDGGIRLLPLCVRR